MTINFSSTVLACLELTASTVYGDFYTTDNDAQTCTGTITAGEQSLGMLLGYEILFLLLVISQFSNSAQRLY